MLADMLEAIMLLLFSVSWFFSIFKTLKTNKVDGKCLIFVGLICLGYLLGVGAKLSIWHTSGEFSFVIVIYVFNLLVTAFDAWLILRLRSLARMRQFDQTREMHTNKRPLICLAS
ncbi:MAG: hypothetical protein AAFY56_13095 [Pseudomonadota bacterium]